MTETVRRKAIHRLIRRRIELNKKIKGEDNEELVNKYKEEIKLIEETIFKLRRSE